MYPTVRVSLRETSSLKLRTVLGRVCWGGSSNGVGKEKESGVDNDGRGPGLQCGRWHRRVDNDKSTTSDSSPLQRKKILNCGTLSFCSWRLVNPFCTAAPPPSLPTWPFLTFGVRLFTFKTRTAVRPWSIPVNHTKLFRAVEVLPWPCKEVS